MYVCVCVGRGVHSTPYTSTYTLYAEGVHQPEPKLNTGSLKDTIVAVVEVLRNNRDNSSTAAAAVVAAAAAAAAAGSVAAAALEALTGR